jgi:hypothetical protein
VADLQKCSDSNRAALRLKTANAASENIGSQSKFELAGCYSTSEIQDALREYHAKHTDLAESTLEPLYLVDINNDFAVLPHAWQRTNLDLGEQSLKLCYNHDDLDNDVLADAVHKQWLEANPWAKDGPLDVPYEELSPAEQAKDMSQVLTCQRVLAELETLRRDFTERSHGQQLLEPGDLIAALGVYRDTALQTSHSKPVDFEHFCRLVLPDIEKRIAQEMFGVDGVDMVSVRLTSDDDPPRTLSGPYRVA